MTTKRGKKAEVLPAEDVQLDAAQLGAVEDATTLVDFIRGLVPFFAKAAQLETAAHQTLVRARSIGAPTTKDDDAYVQQEVRQARELRKDIEAHWSITAIVSRFHKKLTSKRGIATDPCERAETILVGLHDRYVAQERARAAAEQARQQAEADARAEEARKRDLAEYEAAALRAEANSPELSVREQQFVTAIVNSNYEPVVAARAAGYKDPVAQAALLLARPKIQAALKARQDALAIRNRKAIVETLPVFTEDVTVEPELNAGDRYTWSGEVVDLELLRKEAFTNRLSGIPLDLFVVDQTKLNQYARSLHEQLERWPGVVVHRKTTVL